MKIMKNVFKLLGASILAVSFASFASAEDYKHAQKVKNEVEQKIDGKILVQQFLWHKCIHCYKLDPLVDKWSETKPSFIEFERVPVVWSDSHKNDAYFYNYAKTLRKTNKITDKDLNSINANLFKLTFEEEKELTSENVYPLFKDYGVSSAEELDSLVKSFAASNENMKSVNLTNQYGIQGVPIFVVNGKYIVGFQTLKDVEITPENLFKAIEEVAKGELIKK